MATAPRFAVSAPAVPVSASRSVAFIRSRWWLLAVILGASLFATFVWPTQYRYDNVKLGPYDLLVRTHRFTGHVQQLTRDGWVNGAYYKPY